MMKDVKLIIFDLDGTLIDAYPAITSSFNHTMKKLGYPRQPALSIRRAVGWGDENLLRPYICEKDLSSALSIYRGHHRSELRKKSRLLKGAFSVLKRLKDKGYILAVASNRPERFSRILIRHLKIGRYFRYVLCADKLNNFKPNPEILNKILQKFALEPRQAIYVGDMGIDAQAGRRAKVRTIIVTTGSSLKSEIKKERPYRIISKISKLLKTL